MATRGKKGGDTAPVVDSRFTVINEWVDARTRLASAQAREREARMAVGQFFGVYDPKNENPREGSAPIDVMGGPLLSWKQPYNYKLDAELLEVSVVPKLKEAGIDTDELFRYKPELNMKPYRELKPEALLILADALSITPGMPQLEITRAGKEEDTKALKKLGRKGST